MPQVPTRSQLPNPQPVDSVTELPGPDTGGGFWRLVPGWVSRGPYAPPRDDVLRAVLAGLQGLQRRLEGMASPASHAGQLEPVPHPGCGTCSAAGAARAHAHMAGNPADVTRATEVIRRHPHER